ncbi:hypothetical protein [Leeuwenhoekiella sp. H156]|uniref:hypothetical protein n=1 Tax=Leeuwenhoekiella sp. H156 TaxID=3450128 RepID=UPI003FA44F72
MKKNYVLVSLMLLTNVITGQEQSLDGFRFHNGTTMKGLIWGNQSWANYFSRIDDYSGNLRIMSDDHIYFTDINTVDGKPGNNIMYLNTNSLRVGIGTTEPKRTLDVRGDIFIGENEIIGERPGGGDVRILGYAPLNPTPTLEISEYSTIPSEVRIYTPTDPDQGVSIYSNKRLVFFRNDGFVGIGTSNSGDFKLGVNGAIRANEIKVETGWADFVFDKNYDLPSLGEVKEFIAKYGHLDNIPSATEVEENGIFLGEMNAKLLQKIEELTLYTIQQDQQLEEQNNQLEVRASREEELTSRLADQEKLLNRLLKRLEILEKQ